MHSYKREDQNAELESSDSKSFFQEIIHVMHLVLLVVCIDTQEMMDVMAVSVQARLFSPSSCEFEKPPPPRWENRGYPCPSPQVTLTLGPYDVVSFGLVPTSSRKSSKMDASSRSLPIMASFF